MHLKKYILNCYAIRFDSCNHQLSSNFKQSYMVDEEAFFELSAFYHLNK